MTEQARLRTHPCPDCGQPYVERHLRHLGTCPVGRAEDEMMDADRDWFAAHPRATEYWRPVHQGERDALSRLLPEDPGGGGEWVGRVLVMQVAPGVRTRWFGDVAWVPRDGEGRR